MNKSWLPLSSKRVGDLSLSLAVFGFFVVSHFSYAQSSSSDSAARYYRYQQFVIMTEIAEPTLVSVPVAITQYGQQKNYYLADDTGSPQPYELRTEYVDTPDYAFELLTGNNIDLVGESISLRQIDNDWLDIYPRDNLSGNVSVLVEAEYPITIDEVSLALTDGSNGPQSLALYVQIDPLSDDFVLVDSATGVSSLGFQTITADTWRLDMAVDRSVRIDAILPNVVDDRAIVNQELIFQALPDNTYTLYTFGRRSVASDVSLNLAGEPELIAELSSLLPNPNYQPADRDRDGVPDTTDNCPLHNNPEQLDSDNDGIGNYCEDSDRDYVIDGEDNCPMTPNRNQADRDIDGVGDLCDESDSRVGEAYTILPWLMIAAVSVVLGALFLRVLYVAKKREEK